MKEYVDALGRELCIGDKIAYVTRGSCYPYLNFGEIEGYTEVKDFYNTGNNKALKVRVEQTNWKGEVLGTRLVTIHFSERIVKIT